MNALARDYMEALESVLRENGVEDWTVSKDSKHKKIRFLWHGKTLTFITPSSPSDRRGVDNAVSDLRKTMGVKRLVKKNPANRQKAHRATPAKIARLKKLDAIIPPHDPWAPLLGVKFTEPTEPTPFWERIRNWWQGWFQ